MALLLPYGFLQSGADGGQVEILDSPVVFNGDTEFTVSEGADLLIVMASGGRYQFSADVGSINLSWQTDTFIPLHNQVSGDVEPAGQVSTSRFGLFYVVNPTPASAQTLGFSVGNSTGQICAAFSLTGVDVSSPFRSLTTDMRIGGTLSEDTYPYTLTPGEFLIEQQTAWAGGNTQVLSRTAEQGALTTNGFNGGGGNRYQYQIASYVDTPGSINTSHAFTDDWGQIVFGYVGVIVQPS